MQTSLQAITAKARRFKNHRFRNLYGMINERFLQESWFEINRKAFPGFDRVTANEYASDLKGNIKNLVERLRGKRYRAKLVRRTYIPKGSGEMRPLGIPATEDRLLQKAAARILTAIFEPEFLPCSFGYRTGKGAGAAVQDVTINLQRRRYTYMVEAVIKGSF